ncbi:MAG: PEGA domain-containing protein [Myxococcales bacterium]|nr:PEGA domain-containing protein [Myxococcales bacterium]
MVWKKGMAVFVMAAFTVMQLPTTLLAKSPRDGKIVILSTTVGAEIRIDGQSFGLVPNEEPIAVAPGEHEVLLIKRGYADFVQLVEVRPGKTVELEIDLIAVDGILRAETPGIEDAAVRVNGQIVGSTPFDGLVPAGDQVITISKPGYVDFEQKISFGAGSVEELTVNLAPLAETADDMIIVEPTPSVETTKWYEEWWLWTIVGAATATGVGLGLYYGLQPTEETFRPDVRLQVF